MRNDQRPSEPTCFPLILLGVYIGMLLTAMVAGSKVFALGSLSASATVLPYALSFWITDIVSEIYGKETAGRFVLIGLGVLVLANLLLYLAVLLPPAPGYRQQEAFATVFHLTPRLFLAGIGAFYASQLLDVHLFHLLRRRTGGRHLWLRNNLSTLCSQLVDTVIFVVLAFAGVIDGLVALILGQYLLKAIIALLDTPLLYAAVALYERHSRSTGDGV